jgi:ABC-type cobalt transport system substrate-binding protein
MKLNYILLFVILLLIVVFISGCTQQTTNPSGMGQEQRTQSTTIEDKKFCPDFSSLSDRISCEGESCYFTVLNDEGVAKVDEYKLYPRDATPGEFYPASVVQTPCRKGSEKGENTDYFYCEGMYTIIKETDSTGNILSSKKSSVKLVVHNSKIIDSICE